MDEGGKARISGRPSVAVPCMLASMLQAACGTTAAGPCHVGMRDGLPLNCRGAPAHASLPSPKGQYYITGKLTPSLYEPDALFIDPTTRVQGGCHHACVGRSGAPTPLKGDAEWAEPACSPFSCCTGRLACPWCFMRA